jgi:hypothetical protein
MRTRFVAAALLGALATLSPAMAQERTGCDQFKWPLARERALMAKPTETVSGAAIADPFATAFKVTLVPQAEAKLPAAPERAPREATAYAGFLRMAAPPATGTFRVTLSANAWIDVIQDGKPVPAGEFSGVQGCEGLRKSVKFKLTASPFVVQLSGATVQNLVVTVTQD